MSADRTLPATPRRREQAHRRGLIPTCDGLAWLASIVVLAACLPMWLRNVGAAFADMLAQLPHELAAPQSPLGPFFAQWSWQLAWPTLLLLLITTATGLSVRLLVDRPKLVLGRLAALERLNPWQGFRRLTSPETARQLLVGVVATLLLAASLQWASADIVQHLQTAALDPRDDGRASLWLAWRSLWGVVTAAGVIAMIQQLLRWHASERRLRMTAEELRDEQRLVEANARVRLPTRDAPEEPARSLAHAPDG